MRDQVPARCVVYVRVSTKEQVANLSLETQQIACTAFAAGRGWIVDEVFVEEGESAKTTDRTQLQRMLAHLKARRGAVGFVVVYSLSRLSRNTHDHLGLRMTLARQGALLRSVTEPIDETSSGKLMETMMSAVAQMQNDQLSERVTAGMRAAIERGRWPYPATTGYRNARDAAGRPTFEPDPQRAPLVREAFELAADGVGIEEILRRLRARGLTTRKGRRLGRKALAEILRNPIYAGVLRVPKWKLEAPAAFQPLIDGALFRAVQARLSARTTPYEQHRRHNPDFALKGFLRHVCGRHVVGYWATGRSARHPYYECQPCRERERRAVLEDAFAEMLGRDAQPVAETLEEARLEVLDAWTDVERKAAADAGSLMRRAAALRERKVRLATMALDGAVDSETHDTMRAGLQAELDTVQSLLDRAQNERLNAAGLIDFVTEVLTDAGARWRRASAPRRQALQAFTYPDGVEWSKRAGLNRTGVRGLDFLGLSAEEGAENTFGGPRVVQVEPFLVAAYRFQRLWLAAA